MKTELLLICNAQTITDPKAHDAGWWSDLSLSSEGRRQAMLLGDRLKTTYENIDYLYTSPLKRSAETAVILANDLKVVTRKDAGLRELDAGKTDTTKEIDTSRNTDAIDTSVQDIVRLPDLFAVSGGTAESYASLHRRATRAIDAIAVKCDGKRVIVVTHGGPIVAYLRSFVGFGPDDADHATFFGCATSSLHELLIDGEKRRLSS